MHLGNDIMADPRTYRVDNRISRRGDRRLERRLDRRVWWEGLDGMAGIGVYDPFAPPPAPGSLANPSNPCAPGLILVDGGCFRPIGADGNPVAGPESNNAIAEQVLGGGASCQTERVDVGPYVYEQNICRDPAGNIISGADLVAEHAFVQASLQNPSNPQIFSTTPAPSPSYTSSGSGTPTTPAKPNQSSAPRPQAGETVIPLTHQPSITETARSQGTGNGNGDPGSGSGDGSGSGSFLEQIPPMAWAVAAGLAIFIMSQGGKR